MLLGRTPQKRDDKLAELRDAAEEVHSPPPPPQNAALARVKPPEPTASLVKSWMRGTFKVWSDRDPAYQKIALVATTVATAPKLDHVLTGQVDQTLRATLSEPNLIQIHEGLLNALNGLAFGLGSLEKDLGQAKEYLVHNDDSDTPDGSASPRPTMAPDLLFLLAFLIKG